MKANEPVPRKEDEDPPFLILKPRAKPIYRPHMKFTPDEDATLCLLVKQHGVHSWRLIGKLMPNRNSRQCRERYLNYLSPKLNQQAWDESEDNLLLTKYAKYGPRWMFLCKFFSNRTDQMLKNRFQVLRRRRENRLASDQTTIMSVWPHNEILWESESDDKAIDLELLLFENHES
jgi:hypothetical protein